MRKTIAIAIGALFLNKPYWGIEEIPDEHNHHYPIKVVTGFTYRQAKILAEINEGTRIYIDFDQE